ncbi:carbohydrate-binding protein [Flammeovirga pectinis]|uniref:Carbohydrate-binding protein n=2 Tax=Flammeovirga pectinis TaxID=2494373 RepID=A0A3Q9FSP3_9BACT|nr:carbohydrate-binding protein [Flammeovirga pectinis]
MNEMNFTKKTIVLLCCLLVAASQVFAGTIRTNGTMASTLKANDFAVTTPGLLQAENYSNVTGEIEIESSSDTDGTSTVGYFDPGDLLSFATNVPTAFSAKIKFRVASLPGGDLVLTTNNGDLLTIQIPSTGGWADWQTQEIIVDFPVSNILNIGTTTGAININWIEVEENDCPNPALASLTIKAESLSVLPNNSIQLLLEAFDGCGVPVAVAAQWSANAPNGLFIAGDNETTEIISVQAGGLTTSVTVKVESLSKRYNFVVNHHGRLQASGNSIVGKNGETVSLAGNSLFWSSAAPTWYSKTTVDWLVDDWNTQVIRATMSVNPKDGAGLPWNSNDYVQSPEYTMGLMQNVINAAIENDIYVMVDFHEHYSDQYTAEAIKFFGDIAKQYNGYDNIIYELWNEPINDSWGTVKNHADQVIAEIRKYDPDNLIVVGTPFYSQRVDDAAANQIQDNNVAYALHGYAIEPAHGALRKGYSVPTVGTEWGIGINDNGGGETGAWLNYWRNQDGGKIHVMWAVNNKQVNGDENWSILNANVNAEGGWSTNDLSTSGRFQRDVMRGWIDYTPEVACTNESLESITINAAATSVTVGLPLTLSVAGTSTCDNTWNLQGEWSANVVNGVFTATEVGVSTVSYTDQGISATLQITVTPNQAPIANAGADQFLVQPITALNLQGSASDVEGDALMYSWTQISGPITTSIESPNSIRPLVQGLSVLGEYEFELTVNDANGQTSDIVKITAVANTPPTVNAGVDQNVILGSNANLSASATDAEDDNLSYTWSQVNGPISGTINNSNAAQTTVSGLTELGVYTFEVGVSDGTSSASDQVTVEVTPVVNLLTNGDFSAGTSAWTSFVFESSTASNTEVNGVFKSTINYGGWENWHVQFYQGGLTIENNQSYTLKFKAKAASNRSIQVGVEKNGSPYTGHFSATPQLTTTMQQFEFEFTMANPTDSNARVAFNLGSANADVEIDDVVLLPGTGLPSNEVPVVTVGADEFLPKGTTSTTLTGAATDADNGPQTLTYAWTQTSGAAVTIVSPTAQVTAVTGLTNGGVYTFTLTASDGEDTSSANVEIEVEDDIIILTRIEAENYSGMDGVQTESCSEGGLNVGYIDAWDWLSFDNINIPTTGTYTISYRVASQNGGGRLKFEKAGGSVNYGEISIPSTGGWQNWTTVSHQVTLTAGNQNFAIAVLEGGFNINWLEISSGSSSSARKMDNSKLEQELTSQLISLYPNPVQQQLSIEGLSTTASRLEIYSTGGMIVESIDLSENKTVNVSVENLKAGIYLLRVYDNDIIQTKKFIKR